MKTIKSFSDFDKQDNHVDEQLFKRAREKRRQKKALKKADAQMNPNASDDKIRGVKGKEVYTDSQGTRHKVVWKAQDSTNFIVKLVNDYNWLDTNSNLTPDGQSALLQFLNGENSFTNQYGNLDQAFFQKNVIAYSVRVDTDRRQKIQFTILDKAALITSQEQNATDGAQSMDLTSVTFINAKDLVAIDSGVVANQDILSKTDVPVIDDTKDDDQDNQEDNSQELEKEEDNDIVDEIPLPNADLIGKKFEYQSGADGKIYIITIDEGDNGELEFYAKAKDGSREGWVYLKDGEPFWKNADGSSSAITNAKDVDFFKRIYTDETYLRKLIADFEAKYPNGADWTIKDILYYSNGSLIYQKEVATDEDEIVVDDV